MLNPAPQDLKKVKALQKPVSLGNGDCASLDADRSDDCFRLSKAVQEGHFREVVDLIKKGTDVNNKDAEGFTPLVRSVLAKEAMFDFLIENGADLQIKCHRKEPLGMGSFQ